LLTLREAAEVLRLSTRTMREYVRRGEIVNPHNQQECPSHPLQTRPDDVSDDRGDIDCPESFLLHNVPAFAARHSEFTKRFGNLAPFSNAGLFSSRTWRAYRHKVELRVSTLPKTFPLSSDPEVGTRTTGNYYNEEL
jgi:hypothetical protein